MREIKKYRYISDVKILKKKLFFRPLNKAVLARYDFKTLHSVDIMVAQFSPWIPETIKSWNKTGQYFMGMYVFKVLPSSWSKSLR